MDRRTFLTATLAATTLPAATLPGLARAGTTLSYSPAALDKALKNGETVFLDFKASWCTTCAAQERVINALLNENPAYGQKITFMNVDWDTYRRSEIVQRLNIPRRSTLVVLKGNRELGRLVAQTSRRQIKALMDIALNA